MPAAQRLQGERRGRAPREGARRRFRQRRLDPMWRPPPPGDQVTLTDGSGGRGGGASLRRTREITTAAARPAHDRAPASAFRGRRLAVFRMRRARAPALFRAEKSGCAHPIRTRSRPRLEASENRSNRIRAKPCTRSFVIERPRPVSRHQGVEARALLSERRPRARVRCRPIVLGPKSENHAVAECNGSGAPASGIPNFKALLQKIPVSIYVRGPGDRMGDARDPVGVWILAIVKDLGSDTLGQRPKQPSEASRANAGCGPRSVSACTHKGGGRPAFAARRRL